MTGKTAQGTPLVIVESPAKARTISKFLGSKYKIEASIDRVKADIYKYKTRASVAGETAVEAELMCTMRKVA